MKLPKLRIGNLVSEIPVVLGGMGVGISRSNLAAAVAKEGGMGVISGINIGFNEPDFAENPFQANIRALIREIRLAKEKSNNGIIGVNLMTVMSRYKDFVKAVVEEKIDFIVSGAGLPLELPECTKNLTKIIPIVSSARALKIILKKWDTKYDTTADAVVIEGPKAGGHLGFKVEEIQNGNFTFKEVIKEVKELLEAYEEKYSKKIPVIAAGGIFDRKDIEDVINDGADGVQMSTRFIATEECDASDEYKNSFINLKEEDIEIILSPVGFPARAVKNSFLKNVDSGQKYALEKCSLCLKGCDIKTKGYCISEALINAVRGNIDRGVIFTGTNGYKISKIDTVSNIFKEFR